MRYLVILTVYILDVARCLLRGCGAGTIRRAHRNHLMLSKSRSYDDCRKRCADSDCDSSNRSNGTATGYITT